MSKENSIIHPFLEKETKINFNRSSDNTTIDKQDVKFNFRKFLKFIGPGFLVCMAYLDPGNLSGDMGVGLSGRYALLWVLMLSTLFGFFFQILAAKIGIVTGNDMATLCRKAFRKQVSFPLWLMTEIAIVGSDIQEVLGSAVALNILAGIPLWVGVLITIIDSMIILLMQYSKMEYVEYIFVVLVSTMGICFLVNLIQIQPDVGDLFKGIFLPTVPSGSTESLIALVGCVIMPHNLYLHSSLVQTRNIDRKNKHQVAEGIMYFRAESALTLFMSFVINMCVIGTFAHFSSFSDDFKDGISLQTAGYTLESTFGSSGKYIWAIGLLASGQSATLSGTMAGQFVMEGFLNLKIKRWIRSFVTRSVAIVPAIIFSFQGNFDSLNQSLNILQSIQLPFALIPLLKFSTNSDILGEWKTGKIFCGLLIVVAILMIGLNVQQQIPQNTSFNDYPIYIFILIIILYIGLIIFLIREPIQDVDLDADKKEYFVPIDVEDYEETQINQVKRIQKSDIATTLPYNN